jgi:hypothetical protein
LTFDTRYEEGIVPTAAWKDLGYDEPYAYQYEWTNTGGKCKYPYPNLSMAEIQARPNLSRPLNVLEMIVKREGF